MVVGDDHLEPGRAGGLDLGDRADPAVGGEQQRGAAGAEPLDRLQGEPVAVLLAPRDQPVALGAQRRAAARTAIAVEQTPSTS